MRSGAARTDTETVVLGVGFLLEQARPAGHRIWALDRDRLTIGRDPASQVFVDDPRVSWHHADLVRHAAGWAIVDGPSTNGTYVNAARVDRTALRPGDHIEVGSTVLVLREAAAPAPSPPPPAVRYDVGSQVGNINNVAGDQANYHHHYRESSLRYLASRRGRARHLLVWGITLYFAGAALGLGAVLSFQQAVFDTIQDDTPASEPPELPAAFLPIFGLGAFLCLVGMALVVFGLIARSGAKREARRLGATW